MKTRFILLASCFLLLGSLHSQAQTISTDRLHKYVATHVTAPVTAPKLQTKALAPVGATAVGATAVAASGTIIYTTPTFGVGALAIQKSFSGWAASGTVNPSFTYSIGIGEYSTNTDGSLNIEPYVNLGAYIAGGIMPQTILSGSFQVGGALGIYKYNNIAVGYDVVTKKPFIAIGASVSLFTFKKGLGSTILKMF